jgi:hypothetical protein
MSVHADKSTGTWTYKCFSCGARGSVIDAVAALERITVPAALGRLAAAPTPSRPVALPPPKAPKVYPDTQKLDECVAYFAGEKHGTVAAVYDYATLRVYRLNMPDGKKRFVQCKAVPGGWAFGAPVTPFPLYRLDAVRAAKTVVVVEGEKCADRLTALGFTATTSAGGSTQPGKTDWTPLAGKAITVWRDYDQPGQEYQDAVVAILKTLRPACQIRIVDVAALGLGFADDVADLVAAAESDGKTTTEIAAHVRAIIDRARSTGALGKLECELQAAVDGTRKNISTGWPKFDALTNGLVPEGVMLLGGPPGSTKSFVVLAWLRYMLQHDVPASVLMLENSPSLALRRAMGQISGVGSVTYDDWCAENPERLRTITQAAQPELQALERAVYALPEGTDPTPDAILAWLQHQLETGARVCILDPITAMQTGEKAVHAEHSRFIWSAKRLIEKHKAALVIVTHPAGRPANGKTFSMDDLAGGKAFQRFSQTIAFLHAQKPTATRVATDMGVTSMQVNRALYLWKNNLGRGIIGTELALWFDRETLSISELGTVEE